MRAIRRMKWTSQITLGLLLLATTVIAQPAPTGAEGSPTVVAAGDQQVQAESYVEKMRSTLERMKKLAERARQERDIIRLNCVNDKLIQVKGHLNLGEASRDAMRAKGDEGARSHEFAKLTIGFQKVTVLGQEAEACIGEEISYIGATRVETEVDQNIPDEDPAAAGAGGGGIGGTVIRPPFGSPTK